MSTADTLSEAILEIVFDAVREVFMLAGREPRAIVVSDSGRMGNVLAREVSSPGRLAPTLELVIARQDWEAIARDPRWQAAARRQAEELTRVGRYEGGLRPGPASVWGVPLEIEGEAMPLERLMKERSS
jgi:hypothetical protein